MPTYTYKCRLCGHKWDQFWKHPLRKNSDCPICVDVIDTGERQISKGVGVKFNCDMPTPAKGREE